MMQERRKFPRFNLSVTVNWGKGADVADQAPQHKGTSKDISAGGICLILDERVSAGDVLELEIKLSLDKVIRLKGRVAWIEKFEMIGGRHEVGYEGGIEFIDVSDEMREEISKSIFHLSHKGSA